MRAPIVRWMFPVMLSVAAAGCAPQPAATPPVDTAAITTAIGEMEKTFGNAVAARDTAAIMNYYADDATIMPPNAPKVEGHDAIVRMWQEFLAVPGLELTPTSTHVMVAQSGELAVDVGSYVMKTTGPKGTPVEDTGKFVTVYKKTDAGWRAVVDMFSSDMPVPGQAK